MTVQLYANRIQLLKETNIVPVLLIFLNVNHMGLKYAKICLTN